MARVCAELARDKKAQKASKAQAKAKNPIPPWQQVRSADRSTHGDVRQTAAERKAVSEAAAAAVEERFHRDVSPSPPGA